MKRFRITVYYLYINDGCVLITDILCVVYVHADNIVQAGKKASEMTHLYCETVEV